MYPIFFGQNHYKTDGPSIPEIIKIQPVHHKKFNQFTINYRRIYFLKLDNANSLQQKREFFHGFLTQNRFFPMINHQGKQLTPSESWDEGIFLAWVWGVITFKSLG